MQATPSAIPFELRGDYITLDRLLKATGLAHSGANAKAMVADGQVSVDGQIELRKTAKIRAGQVVGCMDQLIRVLADPTGGGAPAAEPDPTLA